MATSHVVTQGGNYILRQEYNGVQYATGTLAMAPAPGDFPLVITSSPTNQLAINQDFITVVTNVRETIGSAVVGALTIQVYKTGRVVTLNISSLHTNAANGAFLATLTPIPGSYRPTGLFAVNFVVPVINQTFTRAGTMSVGTDGLLTFTVFDPVTGNQAGFVNGMDAGTEVTSVSYLTP
jgi:hypothetical protein